MIWGCRRWWWSGWRDLNLVMNSPLDIPDSQSITRTQCLESLVTAPSVGSLESLVWLIKTCIISLVQVSRVEPNICSSPFGCRSFFNEDN